ncbi:MAG: hypothetical protein KIT31_40280 [Deltaproteobacteria bacterium]|nr:hypothetical protein [Deltaproteobacteria bacterium]
MWRAAFLSTLLAGATAFALPPTEHGRGFREGANHHLGDDSFVANHGRAPTAADGEKARMHEQLAYAHDLLAARPATRPELTARRAQLLGYLRDYIAAAITPVNTYVTWRSPVFIDARGAICAVGYLIERDVGRALPERIADAHRLDFLEDVAAAMPEVQAWVDGSGFTLEELASIQPGYEGPTHLYQSGFGAVENGAYKETRDGITVAGTVARGKMTGAWLATSAAGKVVGKGTFNHGAGAWTSYRLDGSLLAKGSFENNRASGHWKLYHPSGHLAAEGDFGSGRRAGQWNFYYDTKAETVLSSGRFKGGATSGTWRHFDAAGKPLATTTAHYEQHETYSYPDHTTLDVTRDASGLGHVVQTGRPADHWRRDEYRLGGETVIVERDQTFDGADHRLELVDGTWYADPCKRGDEGCAKKMVPVPAARAKAIAATLAAARRVRQPIPAFITPYLQDLAHNGSFHEHRFDRTDLVSMLGASIGWYIELPHVDAPFLEVFATLPGYTAGKHMMGDPIPEDESYYRHDVTVVRNADD